MKITFVKDIRHARYCDYVGLYEVTDIDSMSIEEVKQQLRAEGYKFTTDDRMFFESYISSIGNIRDGAVLFEITSPNLD